MYSFCTLHKTKFQKTAFRDIPDKLSKLSIFNCAFIFCFFFPAWKIKSIFPYPFSEIKHCSPFLSASDCNLLPHLQVWGVKMRSEEYVEKH